MSDVWKQRLKKFPSLLLGDAKELKRLAELLEKCSVIVKDIKCYSNLDSLYTLPLLVKKLPYNLRTRWVKRAVQVENRSGKLANFPHFSEFVQQESKEANSLFGLRSLNVKPSTSKVKAASYTTTSFNSSQQGLKSQKRWGECWYCKSSTHRLIDCKEFTKISIEDQFEFIKQSRLCHKCFSFRHRTPLCEKVNSCIVEGCTNPFHHMLLHFTTRSPVSKRTAPEVSNPNTDNSTENIVVLSTVSKATDSDANVYLCVVPVRVRYKGSFNVCVL